MDVSVENNMLVLPPSVHTRRRLDENFDRMRAVLMGRGMTLEAAMQAFRDLVDTLTGLPDRHGG